LKTGDAANIISEVILIFGRAIPLRGGFIPSRPRTRITLILLLACCLRRRHSARPNRRRKRQSCDSDA